MAGAGGGSAGPQHRRAGAALQRLHLRQVLLTRPAARPAGRVAPHGNRPPILRAGSGVHGLGALRAGRTARPGRRTHPACALGPTSQPLSPAALTGAPGGPREYHDQPIRMEPPLGKSG